MRERSFADPELLATYYGKRGTLSCERGSMVVQVRIKRARHVYGRLELLVEPMWGTGDAWVIHKRVTLTGGEPGVR